MLLNNDRISHWFIGCLLGWAVVTLLLFIPIFHLALGISTIKILISAAIGCGAQLAATPGLFFARATSDRPKGKIISRAIVVIAWFSLTFLLFLYYIQRSWPHTPDAQEFRVICVGTIVGFALIGFIAVGVISRRQRNQSTSAM